MDVKTCLFSSKATNTIIIKLLYIYSIYFKSNQTIDIYSIYIYSHFSMNNEYTISMNNEYTMSGSSYSHPSIVHRSLTLKPL